jgi:hypothetical protein
MLKHRIRECRQDSLAIGARRAGPVVTPVVGHVVLPTPLEPDEGVRIADRQLAQQHSVHRSEDCGVRADADGQRQHDDGRPSFGLHQHAETMTDVFQHEDGIIKSRARELPELRLAGARRCPLAGRGAPPANVKFS